MQKTFLDHELTIAWLEQFDEDDRPRAAKLASMLSLVSADEFAAELMQLLSDRLADGSHPVAIYNETERRHWKGKPNRLFIEQRRKARRAVGKSGPDLVPRNRNVDEEVGSEGVVATILTQFQRHHRKTVHLSPGPDTIRERKVRRFFLVTDFIGSGKRVCDFLDAAWRVRSVRSWWSRREKAGLTFEVIAFCGTDAGIVRIEDHPCGPAVSVSSRCSTIRTSFPPGEATLMEELCRKYAPSQSDGSALGFGQIGALIAFAHSMPNNAPAIFWKSTRTWSPLFPSRVTSAVETPFRSGLTEGTKQKRMEMASGLSPKGELAEPISKEAIVLAALRRSPRIAEAISGRLGLHIETVNEALLKLREWGWIDTHNQITERGRLVLKRLVKSNPAIPLPKGVQGHYFPKSLRGPRSV